VARSLLEQSLTRHAERWRGARCTANDVDASWWNSVDSNKREVDLSHGETYLAVVHCGGCPLRSQCLRAGLHEPWGTWGGASAVERRAVKDLPDAAAIALLEAGFEDSLERRRALWKRSRNAMSIAAVVA
jgi:hypothetical protein